MSASSLILRFFYAQVSPLLALFFGGKMIIDEFVEQLEDDVKAYERSIKECQEGIKGFLDSIKIYEEKIREIKRVLPLLYVIHDEEKLKKIEN